MRKPGPSLGGVDAEVLQPAVQVCGQGGGVSAGICEDEHSDALPFPVARHLKRDLTCGCSGSTQFLDDVRDGVAGCGAEEREREMEVLARHDPARCEVLALPAHDLLDDVVGKAQRAEEP